VKYYHEYRPREPGGIVRWRRAGRAGQPKTVISSEIRPDCQVADLILIDEATDLQPAPQQHAVSYDMPQGRQPRDTALRFSSDQAVVGLAFCRRQKIRTS
jgi:hypothetical protein